MNDDKIKSEQYLPKAIKWLRKAADQGDSGAGTQLNFIRDMGWGGFRA